MDTPANWAVAPLRTLGTWTGGGTPSKRVAAFWNGEIPWVSPKDMKVPRIRDTEDHITIDAIDQSATALVRRGSILVVTRSGILRHTLPVAVADRDVTLNQDLKALTVADGIVPEYVAWALRRFDRIILSTCAKSGTTVQNLETARLLDFQIPVAPTAEQQRIVAAIEEHFSRLDAAGNSLDQASRRLSRLRGAVLEALVDRPAWLRSAVADAGEFVTDGDHNPPPRVVTGIPHLTAKNIKRGRIVLDGCSFVSKEGFEQTRARYEPREGDVVVTCVGTIGQVAVVPPDLQFSADRNLAAIRPLPDVDPRYIQFALSTPIQQRAMLRASGSTAQPHLYLRDLRALEIPLPEFSEQQHIASELDRQLSIIDSMEAEIGTVRHRSSALRRSILEQAFSGKLVPQDPSDEPASLLLERIAAERTAAPKPSRRKRKIPA